MKYVSLKIMAKAAVLLIIAALFVLGAQPAVAHEHSGYSHDSNNGYTNTNWMGALPDEMKLSTLSIPGTHDTMAYQFSTSCDLIPDIVRTQTMDLETQLNSGIRVLDIRLRHAADNAFALHHGSCFLDGYFGGDVMDVVNSFLDAHPSETILMRVKKEHDDAPDLTRTFNETWEWYMEIYGSKVWRGSGNATLGEVRGKIVILDQDAGVSYGLNWSSFNKQDNYDMADNWDLYDKWLDVKGQLADAAAGNKEVVYVNFLSAANGGFPYFFASGHSSPGTSAPRLSTGLLQGPTYNHDKWPDFPRTACFAGTCTISFEGTNILTTNYLAALSQRQRVGIIMADFPGGGLISNVIAMNPWNSPPVANAGGPYTANEGTAITFNAGGSSDPDGDALTYRWDFNSDGIYDTTSSSSPTASYTWHDDFSGTATVEVSDGNFESTATASVTVSNVAPTATAVGDTINENGTATVSGTISDPSNLDTFSVEIDWGEGQPATYNYPAGSTSFSETHQYLDDNPTNTAWDNYAIGVTVTDDDNGVGTASTAVTVNNVAPVLVLTGDTIDENGTATVSGTISDPGTQDTFEVVLDWGEGQPVTYTYGAGTTSFSETHQYLDDNPTATPSNDYTINGSITDDDTGAGAASTTVTVNNVNPVTSIDSIIDETGEAVGTGVRVVLTNTQIDLAGSFTDVGTQDTHVADINWDDGSGGGLGSTTGSIAASHVYTTPGVYTVLLEVTDDDTGVGPATASITVVDAAGAMENLLSQLKEIATDPGVDPAAASAINDAIAQLEGQNGGGAESGALDLLAKGNLNAALVKMWQAMQSLETAETLDANLDLAPQKSLLALTAKSAAMDAIVVADVAAVKRSEIRKVADAYALIDDGDAQLVVHDYVGAVDTYRAAAQAVQGIVK